MKCYKELGMQDKFRSSEYFYLKKSSRNSLYRKEFQNLFDRMLSRIKKNRHFSCEPATSLQVQVRFLQSGKVVL